MAVSNGWNRIPPGTRGNLLFPDRFAAPRRDDDVRTTTFNILRLNDPVLGELRMTQLRENRVASRDFDQFLHPPDPRDQRVIPFFKIDPRTRGEPGRVRADLFQALFERAGKRLSALGAANQPAEHANHLKDLRDAALVE